MKVVEIDSSSENQRIDKFLLKYLNKAGKSFIYKMLRKKRIKYNGKKASGNEILKAGDLIQIYFSEETIDLFKECKKIEKTDYNFSIVYEDENIIVCNKPEGLPVQKDLKNKINTLNDQLLFYLYKKGEYLPENKIAFTPSICNRIDRNTSGIVLFGKNFKAVQALNDMIRNKKVHKFYLTVLNGVLDENGIIEAYHFKDEKNNIAKIFDEYKKGSSKIITKYKRISENGKFSFAEIDLITGKSHQIRAGFKYIGHSIIGDKKYGDLQINKFIKDKYRLNNQFLHAYKIVFKNNSGFFKYLNNKVFTASFDIKKEKIIYDLFGIKGAGDFEKY